MKAPGPDIAALKAAEHNTKILFPRAKITKGELIAYYEAIAPAMLPFLIDRPLSMQRFPNGVTGQWFYQKNIPDYFPRWIDRYRVTNSDGSITTYVICQNVETLMYLANQACITPHMWLSLRDKPQYPDRIIFDLDPGEKTTFAQIQQTALQTKALLDTLGLPSFPMTTGSRGIHIVIPIKRTVTYEITHAFARAIAQELVINNPTLLTLEIRKEKRAGKLFVDALRNTYGHTAVAPYAVRALDGAPVAAPLTWDEVPDKKLDPQKYTIKNIFRRLDKVGDVWKEFETSKATLSKALINKLLR